MTDLKNELIENIKLQVSTMTLKEAYLYADKKRQELVSLNNLETQPAITRDGIVAQIHSIFPDTISDVPVEIRGKLLGDIMTYNEIEILIGCIYQSYLLKALNELPNETQKRGQ